MSSKAGVVALALCLSAQAEAQIAPTGPPQNAPPSETMQPTGATTEAEAKRKLSEGGYPDVRDVVPSEGGWTGTAQVNGRKFTVHLDRSGHIERRN